MRPPIIVDARGDLLVFSSIGDAQRALAPADVKEGHYPVAYDADGRRLRIEVRTEEHKVLGMFPRVKEEVQVIPVEHIPTHEKTLREFLLRFIRPRAGALPSDPGPPAAGILRTGPEVHGS